MCNGQSPSLLSWRLASRICWKQILHRCWTKICTHRRWSSSYQLEKCRMFILGCPDVIVVTDHEPLKGLFGNWDLSKIHNPRLSRLKEKSLRYRFTMQHCPGKWHRAPDAISRNTVTTVQSLLDTFPIEPSPIDTDESDEICAATRLTALTSISQLDGYPAITSLDRIRFAGQKDTQYTLLGKTIDNGLPNSLQATPPTIREYWEVRNRLSNNNGLILLDWRIVIPTSQHKNILKSLHLAHQVVGMKTRVNESVYWPGMNASITEIIALHAQGMPQVYHMNQSKWHLHQNGLFNKLLWICYMLDHSRISLVQTGSLDGSFCTVSSRDKQLPPGWYPSAEKYSKHTAHLRSLAQTVGYPSQLTHSNSS